MKYIFLFLYFQMPIYTLEYAVNDSIVNDSTDVELHMYNVDDIHLQSLDDQANTLLSYKDSCFYNNYGDKSLSTGFLQIEVVEDRSACYDTEQNDIFALFNGNLKNGKKNGEWQELKWGDNTKFIKTRSLSFSNGELDGDYYVFNEIGDTIAHTIFIRGTGLYLNYYLTGEIKEKGYLNKGKRDGLWYFFDKNGDTLKVDVFKKGICITGY